MAALLPMARRNNCVPLGLTSSAAVEALVGDLHREEFGVEADRAVQLLHEHDS